MKKEVGASFQLAGSKSPAAGMAGESTDLGYAFALPRLVARLAG